MAMSPNLDDYRPALVAAAPVLADTLDALAADAGRALSPQGLAAWLEGAGAIVQLGRGGELLLAWLTHLPAVARECGEDTIGECSTAVMKLSSLTSGAVIALVLDTLPTAARRLGDGQALSAYLALLHRLASRAPRGLRVMLGQLDTLLARLSLSGLRRWVDFGAEAYARDFAGQVAYFGLETEDSRAVLQRERRGTLFVDSQRKLNFYLRALWGRDFFLRPSPEDGADHRPYLAGGAIHLPDAVDDLPGPPGGDGPARGEGSPSGVDLYRAMAAHLAAHVVYADAPLADERLNPAQRFFVGLLEDARVESCAIRRFPGLARLWRRFHGAGGGAPQHEAMPLIEAFALGLLEPSATTGDGAVDALLARFHAMPAQQFTDVRLSLAFGLMAFELFDDRRMMPSLRVLEGLRIAYRDDNRMLWQAEEFALLHEPAWGIDVRAPVRKRVPLTAFVNEVEVETAGDDAQEIWTLDGVLYDDDGTTFNEREGRAPLPEPVHYPEWDYRVQLYRPDWATVYERGAARGDPAAIDAILAAHKPVAARIRQIVDRLRPQGVSRLRKLEDGDELDINAVVDAMVDLRSGRQPDLRMTLRNQINRRDLSVLILLDLSESANESVRGAEGSVLSLTREASALIATAIAGIGDAFAIHGFSSDGRHDVRYTCFKDFSEPLDGHVKARLAGMRAGLSTRMGAAMRHAARKLARQPTRRKLLLVITDGEPADIDERDPQTLRQDARKAVEGLRSQGVDCYCLTLDPHADRYVEQIFGAARYTIIDDVRRLPERLPLLFASLTRRR